jgi:hypothetical protein
VASSGAGIAVMTLNRAVGSIAAGMGVAAASESRYFRKKEKLGEKEKEKILSDLESESDKFEAVMKKLEKINYRNLRLKKRIQQKDIQKSDGLNCSIHWFFSSKVCGDGSI